MELSNEDHQRNREWNEKNAEYYARKIGRHVVDFKATPTVVCVLLPLRTCELLLIRRGLKDGYGQLALPGGFQNCGESVHDAAVREVREETGAIIRPDRLELISIKTDEYGHNVVIFRNFGGILLAEGPFTPNEEVLELVPVDESVPTAYPFHTEAVAYYFKRLHNDISWVKQ